MGEDAERIIVGISYSALAAIVSSVFLYIAGVFVMGLLGPEQYGLYQLVFIVPSLLSPMLNLGIESTMVRFVPKYLVSDPARATSTTRYLLLIRVAISLLATLAMFLLSPWIARLLDEPVSVGVRAASVFLLSNLLYIFVQAIFQAYFLMRERAVVITVYGVAYMAIVIPMIFSGMEYLAPITAFALAGLLAMLTGFILAWRKGLAIFGLPSGGGISLREEIRFAAPVYSSSLLGILFAWIGVILIKAFGFDVVSIGYFRGIYNIVSAGLLVATSLAVVVMPYVSELESKGNHAALAFFCTKVTKLLIVLGLPAAVGLSLLSKALLEALLPGYLEAVMMMQILSLLLLFMPIYNVSNTILIGIGKPDLVNYASAIICAVALIAGAALGAIAGIEGVALAYVISMFVGLVFSVAMMTKHTSASVELYSTAKAILATALMSPAVYLVLGRTLAPLARLGLAVLVGLAVYSAVAYVSGTLTEEDFRMLRTALAIAKQKTTGSREVGPTGAEQERVDEHHTKQ